MKKILIVFTFVVLLLQSSLAFAKAKYTFYHILWSMTDVNVQFHIKGGDAYMKSHPDVEIKYVGPESYDPAEHAKLLDTVLEANPDGIAMHISSPEALLPGLKKAKEKGIPFVSTTGHPSTAEAEALIEGLYIAWVGADETLSGGLMGRFVQKHIEPVHVVYTLGHLGHAGLEMRANGLFDSMPAGVKTHLLPMGDEPVAAKEVIRSYLVANPDVNVMMGVLGTNKWISDVVEDLGREGEIALLTSDGGPSSLEAILQEKYVGSFGQQLPTQGPWGYEILYNYNEYGMWPIRPIVTGPALIDASNAQQVKDITIAILGEDEYYKASPY